MPKIKLKDWAEKHNLSYITANRHFHLGLIPGAEQLDSGTILVEDDSLEQTMAGQSNNEAMSIFLKKTVEFSKNNSTVEDFAAFVISNFRLQLNNVAEPAPRYSKKQPKPEDVQKHFQRFLPDKEAQDRLKEVKNLIKEGKNAGEVVPAATFPQVVEMSDDEIKSIGNDLPEKKITNNLSSEFGFLLSEAAAGLSTPLTTDSLVTQSVDFDTTPLQKINYTGSTNQTISSSGSTILPFQTDTYIPNTSVFYTSPFQPTQKELLSVTRVIETAKTDAPRTRRGRKPIKRG